MERGVKMRKIIICFFMALLFLSGCGNKEEKRAGLELYFAIDSGNLQGVKDVLKDSEINLEKLPYKEFTNFREEESRALGYALDSDSPKSAEIAKCLIDAGADVESKGDEGITYVGYESSVTDGEADKLKLLLEAGADPTVEDDNGYSAIEHSVSKMDDRLYEWKEIELLMDYGAQLTDKALEVHIDNHGYLFGKKMVEDIKGRGKKTGLKKDVEYALCGESEKLLEYLKHHKVSDKDVVLRYAAANCNVQALQQLKKAGCNLAKEEDTNIGWINPLYIASRYNEDEKVVEYLLNEGVNPDMKGNDDEDFYRHNALTMAAIGGKERNIKILRKWGVKWRRKELDLGDTWVEVCREGTAKSVKVLLDAGFEPTAAEIMEGYGSANEETLEGLLQYQIPYNQEYMRDGESHTGFSEMCYMHPKQAFEIYKNEENIKLTEVELESIFLEYNEDFIRYLAEHEERQDGYFLKQALKAAINNGDYEMVRYLVEKGADLNTPVEDDKDDSYTVMHVAAQASSKTILNYLIEKGGDMNVKNSDGETPEEIKKMCDKQIEELV